MATIRAYTTIEQSGKLAEILPLESADFHFSANLSPEGYLERPMYGNPEYANYSAFPCWSLTALLDVIPQVKIDNIKQYNKKHWRCCAYFASDWHDSGWYYNPVDACYVMILKLKELNLL